MKKILILGCAALVAMGCASTGPVRKSSTVSPMGIVTVSSSKTISWYGKQKSSGMLAGIIDSAIDPNAAKNIETLLPVAESLFRESLSAKGVQLLDASAIQGAPSYAAAKEDKLMKSSGQLVGSGYRYVAIKNADLAKSLAKETGIASGAYVFFDFCKQMKTGVEKNGVAMASLTMVVGLVDAKGKQIAQKAYYGRSEGSFPIVAGVYDNEKLLALYPEAIKAACAKFAQEFGN